MRQTVVRALSYLLEALEKLFHHGAVTESLVCPPIVHCELVAVNVSDKYSHGGHQCKEVGRAAVNNDDVGVETAEGVAPAEYLSTCINACNSGIGVVARILFVVKEMW
jgi:hypothetical protein